jgi:hypothetical protein
MKALGDSDVNFRNEDKGIALGFTKWPKIQPQDCRGFSRWAMAGRSPAMLQSIQSSAPAAQFHSLLRSQFTSVI